MTKQFLDDCPWEFTLGEIGEDVELTIIFSQELPEEWDEAEIYF